MAVRTGPVDLEHAWADATGALSLAIADSGAVLSRDPLPVVTGDPRQLTMLLQNLLGNAIKFAAPGLQPRVELTCEPAPDPAYWQLSVSDNGIGIPAEYADRAFVIFQRLHGRDEYPSNRIGLALCRKITEFHGGIIELETTRETGTRISFTLPRAQHGS